MSTQEDLDHVASELRAALMVSGDARYLASYARGWIEERRAERDRAIRALMSQPPEPPVEPVRQRVDADAFCERDTREMAEAVADVAQRMDSLDEEWRAAAKARHTCYLGIVYMWLDLGRELADMDGQRGELARRAVGLVYDGMLTRQRERVGEWIHRTEVEDLDERHRERRAKR